MMVKSKRWWMREGEEGRKRNRRKIRSLDGALGFPERNKHSREAARQTRRRANTNQRKEPTI
jgi:hypothetical protein